MLNAAAVTSGSTIDLHAGAVSTIAGRALTIAASTQIENAYGGDGGDTLIGNSAANQLYGARGDDLLEGAGGNDQLDGGAGQDIARFAGARSRYTITAEGTGYRVIDSQTGGDGSDLLVGIEKLQFSDGLYNLDGTLAGGGSGGSGGGSGDSGGSTSPNDTLTGTAGADVLDGGAGDDQLFGMDGNDDLIGGTGADRLDGGAGEDSADYHASAAAVMVNLATNVHANGDAAGDQLFGVEDVIGSNFADQLTGDSGANQLLGKGGDAAIDGGAGADSMAGGVGNDVYYVDNAADLVTENAGEGTDRVVASLGWTLGINIEELVLTGSAAVNGTGNSLDNSVTGNAGANILDGVAGLDSLFGNAGNDTLYGRDGADLLDGGDGADLLIGGNGRDGLRGGLGSDRFDFDTLGETAVGYGDRILDFERGIDKIDLSGIDAKAGTKKNDAFLFIGAADFSGVAGQLHYKFVDLAGTTDDYTLIQGDTNGDKVADFEIVLLGQLTALQAGDFVL
jgi:Ca2+-binding RTX toxin-like protein